MKEPPAIKDDKALETHLQSVKEREQDYHIYKMSVAWLKDYWIKEYDALWDKE
jgi:hypothetical protein